MKTIQQRYSEILEQIRSAAGSCHRDPADITLIAVSKKKDVQTILEGIDSGIRHLGENYIQEAVDKIEVIRKTHAVSWHFIGHLQSNKAKLAVTNFDVIHSVDSVKLAREINKHARNADKKQRILLQINIGDEQSKSGLKIEETMEMIRRISTFENISLEGLMGMPPFFDDPEASRPYLKQMFQIKNDIKAAGIPNISMQHLSMGMSNDFRIAIEEGATMVRIGTAIFGSRA